MTDDRNERELAALFEKTASTPPAPVLTKLLARSADVPGRARRRSRVWLALPVALVGAAGVFALVLVQRQTPSPRASLRPAPAARTARSEPTPAPLPPPSAAPRAADSSEVVSAPAAAPDDDSDDTLGIELDDPSDSDDAVASAALDSDLAGDDGDDALDGPSSDADLDAWLEATSELLEQGG